ncbi:unnamed protein product, partial [Polarella glacialis]
TNRIFDLARHAAQEHDAWLLTQEKHEESRRERVELMRIATDTPKAAPARSAAAPLARPVGSSALAAAEVSLMFHMPDKRQVSQNVHISSVAFDVYTKAYELLEKKDIAFTMNVSGPRGGAPRLLSKELDEGTWSASLSGLGLVAGGIYDVQVSQN